METEIVALDVYGTMLATNDPDNELPPRRGLIELLDRFLQHDLTLCTCSDGNTTTVKMHLEKAGIKLDYFDEFFQMELNAPKNFIPIIDHYKIDPSQLTVIGDSIERDIRPALRLGCHAITLDEYFNGHEKLQDLSLIIIK